MRAIFKREFRSCFTGMIGWLLTAAMAVVGGIYFFAIDLSYGDTDFTYQTLYRTVFMLWLYVPVLTMRSLAEEKHSRTDQLLLTSPVSVWGIVLGKYFSMCAVFALPCLVYACMVGVLALLGAEGAATLSNLSGLLCYYLLGCAAIAIGEFVSGLTENQIVSAVLCLGALLLAYLMPSIQTLFTVGSGLALVVFAVLLGAAALLAGLRSRSFMLGCGIFSVGAVALVILFGAKSAWLTSAFSAVLGALCLFGPFEEFTNYTFSVPAIVYYFTVAGLFLFLTAQAIEKRRWN